MPAVALVAVPLALLADEVVEPPLTAEDEDVLVALVLAV